MKLMNIVAIALLLFSTQVLAQAGPPQGQASNQGSVSPDKGAESTAQSTTAGAEASAQSAAGSAQAQSKSPIPAGTVISAQLSGSIDAKKVKQGDQVQAKTTQDVVSNGTVLLPRNTKLVGHVTQVQPATKDSPNSSLGIALEKAVLKNGQQMPIRAAIQAIAPAPRVQVSPATAEDSAGGASSGAHGGYASTGGAAGAAGGMPGSSRDSSGRPATPPASVGSSTGGGANSAGGTATATPGMTAGGELTPTSKGVMGYPGLMIDSSATSGTQGTVINGQNKNVKLDKGTQILLRVTD